MAEEGIVFESTKTLVAVLKKLKENNVVLVNIVRKTTLGDLLNGSFEDKAEVRRILNELNLDEKWPVGRRLSTQKEKVNIENFKQLLEAAEIFSEDELDHFLGVRGYTKDAADELISVLLKLKLSGIDITTIIQTSTIDDLLKESGKSEEEQEKILAFIGVNRNWLIGRKVNWQKRKNTFDRFKSMMQNVDGFSKEEVKHFTRKVKYSKVGELVEVMSVLKRNGVPVTKIENNMTIGDLLERAKKSPEEQKRILNEAGVKRSWPIWQKFRVQKYYEDAEVFRQALEQEGVFTSEEIESFLAKGEYSKEPTRDLVEILEKLKDYGLSVVGITNNAVLGDLLKNMENDEIRKEILKEIGKSEEWPIGSRIGVQKKVNKIARFKELLEAGGKFTIDEIQRLTTVKRKNAQEIGMATYDVPVEACDKAARMMLELSKDKVHGG